MVPEGWREATYGGVCEINGETLAPSTPAGEEIVYLDIGSIPELGRLADALQRFRFADAPSRARRVVRDGDVVVSTVRPYLRAFARINDPPEGLIASTGFAVLRPGAAVRSDFLFQSVCSRSFMRQLEERMVGSNYPAVNTSDVGEAKLLLPPLPEQKKIAAILSSVDDAIAATRKVIQQTERLKKGLLQTLMTRGIGHTRFRKTEIGEIPDGWEVVRLGEVFQERKQPGVENLPTLSVTLTNGLVNRESLDRRVESELPVKDHLLVKTGDLAYNTMRMWQGACGVAAQDGIVSPAYVVVTPSERLVPAFVAFLVQADFMVNRFFSFSQGITKDRLRLYYDQFCAIPVALPAVAEQVRIAAVLGSIEDEVASTFAEASRLQTLKAALLQALLTGRVRVPVD